MLSSGEGVSILGYIADFCISVAAQVVGYFLCKWLDRDSHKGK